MAWEPIGSLPFALQLHCPCLTFPSCASTNSASDLPPNEVSVNTCHLSSCRCELNLKRVVGRAFRPGTAVSTRQGRQLLHDLLGFQLPQPGKP